ncbi:uncharacterized protein LOC105201230 [Solenopsis invicta]|uniref:uncharacterized protein LOC105201230 n=1 Tax=Solenopsis invicta TaxID=13686 RepID=UPI0005963C50|nr:uncharacterized protein LOC105201230 [Solenopsis invicta]
MSEQIATVHRYYEALEYIKYKINRQEAIEKISTLHSELEIKNADNFADRFSKTASIIEENLTIFKSACDHVDEVTNLLEYLYSINAKMMFSHNDCSLHDLSVIYMFIIFEDYFEQIPSFLKMAIIKGSCMEKQEHQESYKSLISDKIIEMIVFQDSDLCAVISCLNIKPYLLLKIKKIMVQETIKEKFIWLLEQNCKYVSIMNLPIYTFRSKEELLEFFSEDFQVSLDYSNLSLMSIWSEDITAAKALAMKLNKTITFINANFEFCYGIVLPFKGFSTFDLLRSDTYDEEAFQTFGDKINLNTCTGSVYYLFYDGRWQEPVKKTYWKSNDNIYAQATWEDFNRCTTSAIKANKDWRILPLNSKLKILTTLVHTLQCNGKFLLATHVAEWIRHSNVLEDILCCYQDEKFEISSFHTTKGVISLMHKDENVLFSYLTLSLLLNNCVVVLCNETSSILAPYFNMFSTAGIPPGVVNLLLNKNMHKSQQDESKMLLSNVYTHCTLLKQIVLPLK